MMRTRMCKPALFLEPVFGDLCGYSYAYVKYIYVLYTFYILFARYCGMYVTIFSVVLAILSVVIVSLHEENFAERLA